MSNFFLVTKENK